MGIVRQQRGVAAVVFLAIFAVIMIGVLTTAFGSRSVENDFDAKTFPVLAAAREALIAYAAAHPTLPGRLPCPDTDNDGLEDAPCGNPGTNQLGRLPWKTLGLPDLRDASGECLWYAVSGSFKNDPSTTVNTDTTGSLRIVDAQGNVLAGASPQDRAVAVILAPGPALQSNSRTSVGVHQCGGNVTASNYLDTDVDSGVNNAAINNAAPSVSPAPPSVDTFVQRQAPRPDLVTPQYFNDRLVFITPTQFFPPLERRVAGELKKVLLTFYQANGYYPFANDYGDVSYNCTNGIRQGRFPLKISADCSSPVAWAAPGPPAWFSSDNWHLLTYYAIAPACTSATPASPPTSPPTCGGVGLLTVQLGPVSNSAEQALVIEPGPARLGQPSPCGGVDPCLDGANQANATGVYSAQSVSPAFNDVVVVVAP